MGCCLRSGATYSDAIRVPVPPDVLWETVADLPALPNVVPMVTAFEWISDSQNDTEVKEGARFRETRTHKGREFVLLKTVTRVQADPALGERYLSLGIAHSNGIENTSTLFVQNVPDNTQESVLVLTIALGWGSWTGYLNDLFCRYCLRALVSRYNREEIEGYRDAAEIRYEAMKQGE